MPLLTHSWSADIFYHLSPGRPRADVAYCIRALGRRLSKTRNWAVGLHRFSLMLMYEQSC
jgi:hypothetical protein